MCCSPIRARSRAAAPASPRGPAGHWVPVRIRRAGGGAVRGIEGGRSVVATWDELAAEMIDVVVVAPCGFDLAAAVAQSELVRARLPGLPIVAIDSAAYVVR